MILRPGRTRLFKLALHVSVVIMLAAATVSLMAAMIAGEFDRVSIAALTIGLGALFIVLGIVSANLLNRMYHPESALFTWADVDNLRALAASTTDAELQDWARSLAERVAVVLPGRR